jgi:hypothetical protein
MTGAVGLSSTKVDQILKLGKLFSHELRIKVLIAIDEGGPATGRMLADAGLGSYVDIQYHCRKLHEFGVVGTVSAASSRAYQVTARGHDVLRLMSEFGKAG